MSRTLKVGIISANWGVKCHLPAWRAVEGIEVAAICTSRRETAEAAAKANGIPRAYWNHEEMAADPDLDIIDIGTRPSLRYHMAKAALANGKHIYAGVPLAANADQAAEIVALAEARGLKGATDAFLQHIPAHAQMKRMIDEGFLGEVYSITLGMQINLFNPVVEGFPYVWFADKANGASALRNLGSHSITLLTTLFGEAEEAIGRQRLFQKEWREADGNLIRPQVPDTANALLALRSGAMATVNISWAASGGSGWSIDAYGSRGRLSASFPDRFPNSNALVLRAARPATSTDAKFKSWADAADVPLPRDLTHAPHVAIDADVQPPPCYPMALAFHDLRNAILGLGDAAPSLAQGLHVERVIEAIVASEQSRGWERVKSADSTVRPL